MNNFTESIFLHTSNKIAIIDDSRSITYDHLKIEVQQYAYFLKKSGIHPQEKIVIAMPDSIEWCIAFLASISIGAIAIILSSKTSTEKIRSIDAKLYLTSKNDITKLGLCLGEYYQYSDEDIGFYLTTSGTTGKQKFIVHYHRSLHEYYKIISQPFGVDHNSVIFSSPRLSFGYGLGINIVLGLSSGATIILTDKILSGRELNQRIINHNISHFFSTPVFLRSLIKYTKHLTAIRNLKLITSAGEPLSAFIKEKFLELYNQKILNGYGLSEVLSYVCTQRLDDPHNLDNKNIGKPLSGIEIDIRNGELYVKHPCIAVGYLDGLSDNFQHPWVKTNDLVKLTNNGDLIYISRKDNLIKINGEYVSIDEIEEYLLLHDSVEECIVYTKRNKAGLLELEANIISNQKLTVRDLRKFLIGKVELYKIPKRFYFVDNILKTVTNKKIRPQS